MLTIITFLESLVILVKALDFIYLFQIKEYRIDRFKSFLKEEGFLPIFYLRSIRFPAKKPRNFLILILILVLVFVFYLLMQNLHPLLSVMTIFILPVTSFLFVSFGVIVTQVPVKIYRGLHINQAVQLVNGSKAIFIGITGSYGKTTTKEFLFQILNQKYKVAKTEANQNTNIGVALSIIKNLKKDTQYFIAEIGAYKKGEVNTVCKIIKPKFAILTGIGNQHLDLFGSKENLIIAKSELLQALPINGKAFINKEIDLYSRMIKGMKYEVCLYSTQSKADIFATNIEVFEDKIRAIIHYRNKSFPIEAHLLGKHNVSNLLPCIALAFDLGMTQDEIADAIIRLRPINNKLVFYKGIKGSTIIIDSNNSNVEGFISILETVKNLPFTHKIILSRGIIELGNEKTISYNRILDKLVQSQYRLYTTDRLFKKLDQQNNVFLFKNEASLYQSIKEIIDTKTLLIIEGKFPEQFIHSLLS